MRKRKALCVVACLCLVGAASFLLLPRQPERRPAPPIPRHINPGHVSATFDAEWTLQRAEQIIGWPPDEVKTKSDGGTVAKWESDPDKDGVYEEVCIHFTPEGKLHHMEGIPHQLEKEESAPARFFRNVYAWLFF